MKAVVACEERGSVWGVGFRCDHDNDPESMTSDFKDILPEKASLTQALIGHGFIVRYEISVPIWAAARISSTMN